MKKQITVTLGILVGMLAGIGTRIASAGEQAPPVQIHGYMQNRFYQNSGASTQFRAERVSVTALAPLPNDSNAYVEVYYHPWAGFAAGHIYLESAYYDTPLGPGRIRVGKGRRLTFGITPFWGNRRTTNYGIVSEAITQDRIMGVQYYVQQGVLDSGIALHTNYRLGTRPFGDLPGHATHNARNVPHLSLRDLPGAIGERLQVSGRLGGRWLDGQNGLKVGISGSYSSLDPNDRAFLTAAGAPLAGVANPENHMLQYGPDITYQHPSGFLAQGELYFAEASDLRYATGYVLGGWQNQAGWKAFARYSIKNMHTPAIANPITWDLKQLSLSLVQPIRRGLWLQYEFEKNLEYPPAGTGKLKNDVFLVELFSGF